jgi:hypothetical protein
MTETPPTRQQTQRHIERRSMSRSQYYNKKNFCHWYKLSGHWKETFCWLQTELHPRNPTTMRRVWRVKIAEDEEWFFTLIQEKEVVQEEITM